MDRNIRVSGTYLEEPCTLVFEADRGMVTLLQADTGQTLISAAADMTLLPELAGRTLRWGNRIITVTDDEAVAQANAIIGELRRARGQTSAPTAVPAAPDGRVPLEAPAQTHGGRSATGPTVVAQNRWPNAPGPSALVADFPGAAEKRAHSLAGLVEVLSATFGTLGVIGGVAIAATDDADGEKANIVLGLAVAAGAAFQRHS